MSLPPPATKLLRHDRDFIYVALELWSSDQRRHVIELLRVDRGTVLSNPQTPIPVQTTEGKRAGCIAANIGYNGSGNAPRHQLHRDIRRLLRAGS